MINSLYLRVKRIYEPPSNQDGLRILVDRLWPRGLKKETCKLDNWLKEVAPSDKLRRWFGHDPARWEEFQRRYFEELDERPDVRQAVKELAREKTVTLLYAAHDPQHNNAVALKNYLQRVRQTKGIR
ncbi:MAG: DUF488 domain-containing protein [Candidatus Hydrogenedentes bacterium]|nr:DUF488 domain-containing protein [Candidatus Hydrogenedentota bacterium]